jgi:hypothetical protein
VGLPVVVQGGGEVTPQVEAEGRYHEKVEEERGDDEEGKPDQAPDRNPLRAGVRENLIIR